MSLGLIGRKVGMTRVFNDDGSATAVTVIDVSNNRVSQVKSADTDGYAGVQVTFGDKRASRVNKSQAGHFAVVVAGFVLHDGQPVLLQLDKVRLF